MGDAALLTLVPRRKYDFAGLANNGTLEFAIAKNVSVEQWTTGVLLVRQHALGLAPSATINVNVFASLPSPEDPDLDFTFPSALTVRSLAAPSPALLTASLPLDEVAWLTIQLKGARDTAPGPLEVILSIDLVVRSD